MSVPSVRRERLLKKILMHQFKSEDADKTYFQEWLKELLYDMTSDNQIKFADFDQRWLNINPVD